MSEFALAASLAPLLVMIWAGCGFILYLMYILIRDFNK